MGFIRHATLKGFCGEANADSEGLQAKQKSIHDINIVLPWESDQEEAPGPDRALAINGCKKERARARETRTHLFLLDQGTI